MNAGTLTVEREGALSLVTIHRPSRRNALDEALWTALREAIRALEEDPPRALIVTGAGGHFSAGMDLSLENPIVGQLANAVAAADTSTLEELIDSLKGTLGALSRLPFPTVAAIEGACAGGGLELALACDLRVAGRDAHFSLPETRVGMIPDLGGTVRVARLAGTARAAELCLTGRKLTAEEAAAWGLINRVADPGTAVEAAKELCREVLRGGPLASREVLRVLRSIAPSAEDLRRETEAGARAIASGECLEGVQAFLEKRPPKWAT